MENIRNWAGNYQYNASELHAPESVEQIQELVVRSHRVKVLGTRHSFNGIADTTGCQLSLEKFNRVIAIDSARHQVTVEAGIRYGELCSYLHNHGYALHNLASLPHITVAGACATASHGSGDRNGNLASIVHAMEVVKADGEVAVFSRDLQDGLIDGAAVGLGGLGVITKMTLDLLPDFQMRQWVYEELPLDQLKDHLDAIFSSAYSVSLFTDWTSSAFHQVWVKEKVGDEASVQGRSSFFGARRAAEPRHPVPGYNAEPCSEQLGAAGPAYERLAHFRMEFTPSAGDELQSEYFFSREDAYEALCAIDELREHIAPLLYVSEIRTIARDDLWMSPCYRQDSVAIHFTWKSDGPAVQRVLPMIEKALEPFRARPHWSKLFAMPPAQLQALYAKLADFQRLLLECDPQGKFRNAFLDKYILGD